jgi:hypothetical protein
LRTGKGVQAIFLPPSPPAEKTTARQDQARKSGTGDGAREGRSRKSGHLNAVNEALAPKDQIFRFAGAVGRNEAVDKTKPVGLEKVFDIG